MIKQRIRPALSEHITPSFLREREPVIHSTLCLSYLPLSLSRSVAIQLSNSRGLTYRQVDDPEKEWIIDLLVFEKDDGAPDVGVGPLVGIGVSNIETGDSNSVDFLRTFQKSNNVSGDVGMYRCLVRSYIHYSPFPERA